jgi:hypothetical protein
MDVATVISNIENTIKGKELLLAELKKRSTLGGDGAFVASVSSRFIELNLTELRTILEHLQAIDKE